MKKPLLGVLAIAVISLASCKKNKNEVPDAFTYPAMAEASDPALLMTTATGVKVYNGGYGSALAADPNDPTVFYLMTDRGPNVAGTTVTGSILLGKPDFTPAIGKFRLKDGKLVLEQVINLKNAAGVNLNGLPNPVGAGNTGEIPYPHQAAPYRP